LVMAPVRTGFEGVLRPGHELRRRLAHDTGLPDEYADAVVGQSFPIQMNTTQDLTPIAALPPRHTDLQARRRTCLPLPELRS
ncbi:MAG: hypothetical protein M3256_05980, partial [Actinomycetota bacterium]|nr:hypothetical protein [Actinomycetota bacterium]